jgi:hypothetical protein
MLLERAPMTTLVEVLLYEGQADGACSPGGSIRLVYGEDPSGRSRDVAATIAPKLERHGLRIEVIRDPTDTMVCITGRLRS